MDRLRPIRDSSISCRPFDCLPLRKGDYEVSLKLEDPLHFVSRDVLSLRIASRENLELLSLNVEVERE
jgi:hypothetical protein